MIFLALFAYVIAPDNSENANQMHLSIHSKSPGFAVQMLSIPSSKIEDKTIKGYFFGHPNQVTEIPISSYQIKDNKLQYVEYTEDKTLRLVKEITLDKFKIGTISPVEFRTAQVNYANAVIRLTNAELLAKQTEISLKEIAGNLTF